MLELRHREAVAVGLDHERGHPVVLAIGDREDDVEVGDAGVGDPVLGAVDDPLVAVLDRARAQRRGVRAGVRLRQRKGGRPLAARALRQEPLLQLVGAEQLDRQRAELLDHQDQRDCRRRLRELLDRHLEHQRAGAGAAVLGVERKAEDVLVAEQLAEVLRVLVLRVDLRGARGDLLLGDLPDEVAEVLEFLGDVIDVGHGRSGYRPRPPLSLSPGPPGRWRGRGRMPGVRRRGYRPGRGRPAPVVRGTAAGSARSTRSRHGRPSSSARR